MRCLKINSQPRHTAITERKKLLKKFGITYLYSHRVLLLPDEEVEYNDKWLNSLYQPHKFALTFNYTERHVDIDEFAEYHGMDVEYGILPRVAIPVWSKVWDVAIEVTGVDLNLAIQLAAKYKGYFCTQKSYMSIEYTIDFEKSIEENLILLDEQITKNKVLNGTEHKII